MSVDINPILAVGLEFASVQEAFEYLVDHKVLTEEQIDLVNDKGYRYIYEFALDGLTCAMMDHYSGEGDHYIGYDLTGGDFTQFRDSLNAAFHKWNLKFGDIPEVINTLSYT